MKSSKALEIGAYTSLAVAAVVGAYSLFHGYRSISHNIDLITLRAQPVYVATVETVTRNNKMLESLSKLESDLLNQAQISTTADAPLAFVQKKKAELRSESLTAQSNPLYKIAHAQIENAELSSKEHSDKFATSMYFVLPAAMLGIVVLDLAGKKKRNELFGAYK